MVLKAEYQGFKRAAAAGAYGRSVGIPISPGLKHIHVHDAQLSERSRRRPSLVSCHVFPFDFTSLVFRFF